MAEGKLDQHHNIALEFHAVVNMTPRSLKIWLSGSESKSVGMTHEGDKVTEPGTHEAVGHDMGRRILGLQSKKAADLSDDNYTAMKKVIGYVHRHLKQRPHGEVEDSRWRKSLMNWGHDPMK
ncbi:DUF3140 domain-containing protein [Acidisphaera sp. L21]|uniref:DUF3140 domain-containing protein n=1 Tax=Acidisphaera sp. L21 TaxID=1641851 RepID=UPI00131B4054|nr:DUF3140 domain-containing protein [Acidisphaera sp. L21]